MKLENDTQVIGGTKHDILRKARKMEAVQNIFRSKVKQETMEYGRAHYEALIASGMAWEFHPWLTGNWNDDKERFINEVMSKFKNVYTENQNREV